MVELVLGTGSDQAVLTAHQAMLVKSPYFADVCAQFGEGSKVPPSSLPCPYTTR